MADLDIALKLLGEPGMAGLLKLALGRRRLRLRLTPCGERDSGLVPQQMEVDKLYHVRIDGEAAVLHFEAQDRPRGRREARRIQLRASMAHDKHQVPVLTLILYAAPSPRGHTPASGYEMGLRRLSILWHRFFPICPWTFSPAKLLDLSPGLAPLVPLASRATPQHLRRAADRIGSSRLRRKEDALVTLALLARRRFPAEVVRAIIPKEVLMKNPLLEEIRKEGRAEGRQEGRQEGREEGRLEGLREAVLQVLQGRFGRLPRAVRERVMAEADHAALRAMLGRAATVATPRDILNGRASS